MMTSSDRLLVSLCFLLGLCTTVVHEAIGGEPIITTIAGGGVYDGQSATSVGLDTPLRCICAADGSVYFGEQSTHRIRKIAAGTGVITTIAGNGETGSGGVGGPAIAANLNDPSGLAIDAAGDLYVSDRGLGTNYHRICKISLTTGVFTVIAGTVGTQGFSGDNGPATAAQFNWPTGLAFDATGNLYITDQRNHRVRRIDATTGIITTIAGNGTGTFGGDGGAATSASLNNPNAVTFDTAGNIYISDEYNHRVRKITAGIISTAVGTGTFGFSGDNGPATAAQLNQTGDVVMDGNDLYIADALNKRVRLVSGGIITTIAGGTSGPLGDGGPALSARFGNFWSVALTKDGKKDLVIADYFTRRVRKISRSPDVVSTIAGGSPVTSGPATSMWLNSADDVAVDSAGNIFVCDSRGCRVYRIAAGTGAMTLVAGNGRGGSTGDGGQATVATLNVPSSIALDRLGNLYIAEFNSPRIRRVVLGTGVISTYAGNGTSGFSGDGSTATNAMMTTAGGLICDADDNLVLVDTQNYRIRWVNRNSGEINTIAGNGNASASGDGGPATLAGLNSPKDIALSASGDLIIVGGDIRSVALKTTSYITTIPAAISGRGVAVAGTGDILISDSTSARVLKVAANTNVVSVVAGTGIEGFTGDGGPAINATFNWPKGLAVTATGNLLIADIYNFRVRQVALGSPSGPGGGAGGGSSSNGGSGGCGLGSGVATVLSLAAAALLMMRLRR